MTVLKASNPEVLTGLAAGKLDDTITDIIKKTGREIAAKYA
jgi:F-type H+-transporting ATPase subunit alpha